MTRPRPDAKSLPFYYENTYSGDGQEQMKQFQSENWIMRLISKYRIRVMEKCRKIEASHFCLDVGCSYGGFLDTLTRERGCSGLGIDLDESAIEQSVQNERLNFQMTSIQDLTLSPSTMDWITFWESLEHHAEPVEAMKHAYTLLKPGGYCCVEVPNFDGFWRFIFGRYWLPLLIPQHLYHFTRDSLSQVARKAGFDQPAHYQCMFYPLEGVASLGIALGKLLRSPPPGSPPSWRTPFDLTILMCLAVMYLVMEIPSQIFLSLLGRSGHQMAIFQKPYLPAVASDDLSPITETAVANHQE